MGNAIGATLAGIVIIGGVVFATTSIEKIPAGYAGVVYSMSGGVQDELMSQGWHMRSLQKRLESSLLEMNS